MDSVWRKTLECRSLFPHIDKTFVGVHKAGTAPYYRQFGFVVEFVFGEGLTIDAIDQINSVGHYINQNFIVRLLALLEYYKVIGNGIDIDETIVGSEELDILRRLRNQFAHSSGRYNPHDRKQKTLCQRIVDHFDLKDTDPSDFPLSIDQVLEKMFFVCKSYVKEFLEKRSLADSKAAETEA